MNRSDIFKQLRTGTWVVICMVAGCSTSLTHHQKTNEQTSKMTEREYLAFRASHAGHKIAPNELKVSEPLAMATPQSTAAPKPRPPAKPKPVATPAPMLPAQQAPPPAATPLPEPAPTVSVVKSKPSPSRVAPKPVVKTKVLPTQPTAVGNVKKVTPAPSHPHRQPQLVSNTSLSASDGFLSRRHQITSSEKTIKPIRTAVRKPVQATLPLPTLEQLIQAGTVYDARIVLKQVNTANIATLAQAIRIIIKEKPKNGTSILYNVVRFAKAASPRAMAIDALLQAYPQNATYSAQKLLHQTRYNRIDRLVVGNRIMQYRIARVYNAAITNLGYDASGKALFDARRGILAADKAVTRALKNYAALSSTKHASFIARRLFHWIRNDDSIEQAYQDTFVKHPSELGVILFSERFGDEALPLLKQALGEVHKKLQTVVQKQLTLLSDKTHTPKLLFGYHKLFLIRYQTPQGALTLLTDQTIWPDQTTDEIYQQKDATSSFSQQVLKVKTKEFAAIKKLPNQWKSGIKVHGYTLDMLDLK